MGAAMSDEAKSTTNEWQTEATGLLTGYARRMKRRRLLLVAAAAAGTTGVAALGSFIGWNAYLQRLGTEYQHFGLTCSDVREMLPDYRAQLLDARRSELLEMHVRRCSNCKRFLGELREQV
jgi:hypothetical protein